MKKTVIIGGGASGLFLATLLKKDYIILEKTSEIGRKIKISGGGKCNITNKNLSPDNYRGDKNFIKKIFNRFDNKDLLRFLDENHLKVKELKPNQYFFNSSEELLSFFRQKVKHISFNTEVKDIQGNKIITNKGVFEAKNIVIATGGASFKKLGASDIGLRLGEKLGHSFEEFKPALVGLTVQPSEYWFKNLSGISFKADVYAGFKKYSQDILFSHKGITGPAILNTSLWWERGKIKIDFLAGKNVFFYLKNPDKQISTQLPLPKRFVKEFLKAQQIEDKKVKFLSNQERNRLKNINSYEFAPAGTFGFERAEVSKGGINTDEVDFFMRSKKVGNVFFLGEVLNVTGELGGYNFQWAFSSAFSAFGFLRR